MSAANFLYSFTATNRLLGHTIFHGLVIAPRVLFLFYFGPYFFLVLDFIVTLHCRSLLASAPFPPAHGPVFTLNLRSTHISDK